MLFVGDGWAEDHHDVELQDPAGRRLARGRLPEGVVGNLTASELADLLAFLGDRVAQEALRKQGDIPR